MTKLLFAFLVFFSVAQKANARDLTDATGVVVQLPNQIKRVVTLAPSLGELTADILELNLEKIVGVSERTDFPPALDSKPSVGPFSSFNLEKVMSLKPDLILATSDGNPKDRVNQLRELGQPVFVVRTSNVREIEESIVWVSKALGEEKSGEKLLQAFKKGLEEIQKSIPQIQGGTRRPRVLLQIGAEPLVVVGKGSFLDEALSLVGAENVYAELNQKYPKPSYEDALHRNPDWILVLGMERDLKSAEKMAGEWRKMPGKTKKYRVATVQGDTLLRPSLRFIDGLALLRDSLYGSKSK